jgi:16S rRNA (cytosine967-C5)-methyltransferase
MASEILICSGKVKVSLPNALFNGMLLCMKQIIDSDDFADKAVANMLQAQTAWGSRDRKAATRIIYQAARNFLLYRAFIQKHWAMLPSGEFPEAMLSVSLLCDAELSSRMEVEAGFWQQEDLDALKRSQPELKYSLPDWLYEQIVSDWGADSEALLESLDQPAPVYVRLNLTKAAEHQIYNQLSREVSLEKIPGFKAAYKLIGPNRLRQSKAFKEGLFEFQDIGSQYIGRACEVKEEMVVIDLCAGKGGKSLQLAQYLKNEGRIIASDIDETRLQTLLRRAKKAEAKVIEVMSPAQLEQYSPEADVILIDAPCTGTGTLRRQPDLKHHLRPERVAELPAIQLNLLRKSLQWLKPGGRLVYATCSILKAENAVVIDQFLKEEVSVKLLEEKYLHPQELDSDAFYVAILSKRG